MALDPHHTYIDDAARAWLHDPFWAVVAVCRPPITREVQNDTVNHWRLFFVLPPTTTYSQRSIVLDMGMESGTNTQGVCGAIGKPYSVTSYRAQEVGNIPGEPNATVATVLDTLDKAGVFRYRYADSGEECRYWILTAVELLEATGIFAEGAGASVRAIIDKLWMVTADGDSHGIPKPVIEGEFL